MSINKLEVEIGSIIEITGEEVEGQPIEHDNYEIVKSGYIDDSNKISLVIKKIQSEPEPKNGWYYVDEGEGTIRRLVRKHNLDCYNVYNNYQGKWKNLNIRILAKIGNVEVMV